MLPVGTLAGFDFFGGGGGGGNIKMPKWFV
jgi:hypothetical protein